MKKSKKYQNIKNNCPNNKKRDINENRSWHYVNTDWVII